MQIWWLRRATFFRFFVLRLHCQPSYTFSGAFVNNAICNPRRVVGLSGRSVNQLTSGASVRPENDITYSTGNVGQKVCVNFYETVPLQRYTAFRNRACALLVRFRAHARVAPRVLHFTLNAGECTRKIRSTYNITYM